MERYTHKRQAKSKLFDKLDVLVDTKTAAERLGVKPSTLRFWSYQGAPNYRGLGRQLKWDLRELCEWRERRQ